MGLALFILALLGGFLARLVDGGALLGRHPARDRAGEVLIRIESLRLILLLLARLGPLIALGGIGGVKERLDDVASHRRVVARHQQFTLAIIKSKARNVMMAAVQDSGLHRRGLRGQARLPTRHFMGTVLEPTRQSRHVAGFDGTAQ